MNPKILCKMEDMDFKKVNYSEYKGKYDESIKEKMETTPESIDIETMRANFYGYTFTDDYAEGIIADELSMDYWEEQEMLNDNPSDFDVSDLQPFEAMLQDDDSDPYMVVSPQERLLLETIDSTGDGKTPETALCVIDVHQEYEYLDRVVRYCTMRVIRQSFKNGIDCLELVDVDGSKVKLYFDIKCRFDVGYAGLAL